MGIFKGYDVRGIVPDELNSGISYKLGLALSSKFKNTSLGYDTRLTSPALSYGFLSGFLEGGGDVLFQGKSNFGLAMFPAFIEKMDLASFVTASHLPPEYNGLKFYQGDGIAFGGDELLEIIKKLDLYKPVDWKKFGGVEFVDYKRDYISYISDGLDLGGMNFLVDCGGGATSFVAKGVFKSANSSPSYIFCRPNPSLSDRNSEPTEKSVYKLEEECREKGVPGIAFDGDGDRAVFVDEGGRFVPPDVLGLILAKRLVEDKGKGVIVVNASASMAFEELEEIGAQVMRVPVGHTYMTYSSIKNKAVLGVESSGHLIIPGKFPFDDAFVWVLEVLSMLKNKELRELVSEVPVYPKKRVNIDVPGGRKFGIMKNIVEYVRGKFENVNTLDGVRVSFSDGWVLVRASNTSPIIRVVGEAHSNARLNEIIEEFEKIVRRFI